jgi:hypothetical protein
MLELGGLLYFSMTYSFQFSHGLDPCPTLDLFHDFCYT